MSEQAVVAVGATLSRGVKDTQLGLELVSLLLPLAVGLGFLHLGGLALRCRTRPPPAAPPTTLSAPELTPV